MRLENVSILTRREYVSRVRTKAFWLSTLLIPVLMAAVTVLPSLLLSRTRSEQKLVVVDATGEVGALLRAELAGAAAGDGESEDAAARFDVEVVAPESDSEAQRAALDRRVVDEAIGAWVWIDESVIAGERVEYRAATVSNVIAQQTLSRALSSAVRKVRLEAAGIDERQIAELIRPVQLSTVKVTAAGAREEGGFAGAALAYAFGFLLYLAFLLYGSQVLNGVIEEKSSRVVEVVLASARPIELMLGKLFGIGMAGLTQVGIWVLTLYLLTSGGVVDAGSWIPGGLPQVPLSLIAHFLALFLLGYFAVAALYAAIGAACNNVQEAQQFAPLAMISVVLPFLMMFAVINAPDSVLAVAGSLFPPFTPMLMMMRLVVSAPPLWQVALGYLLTTAYVFGMAWLAARIYRIGILMYGKKPTPKELWRWLRHA